MKSPLPSRRLLIATAATATVASLALALSAPTALVVDGQAIVAGVAPVTVAGAVYLPIESVAAAAGAEARFEPASGTIVVQRGGEVLHAAIGSTTATVDGRTITLAHAPFSVRGEAMLAGDDVARALGTRVRYDARRARVDVRTPGVVVAGAADDSP